MIPLYNTLSQIIGAMVMESVLHLGAIMCTRTQLVAVMDWYVLFKASIFCSSSNVPLASQMIIRIFVTLYMHSVFEKLGIQDRARAIEPARRSSPSTLEYSASSRSGSRMGD